MTRALVLLALLSLPACSTTTTTWTRISSSVEANRLIREANGQLRDGNPAAAVRILDDAVRRFPDASGHDQALYDLARALVLSANGGRDYRQASAHLDRLLREYPTSSYVSDARALRIALGAYVARSAELDRLLERLRAIDLEYERPRQP
jgi:outer membrane protein assembly factor BamD (BamD/ComL family)